jgi:predicted TIM-barrel fold metal-dependent hydrolase
MSDRESQEAEIVEPTIAIVDAHHHLRDRADSSYMFKDYLRDVGAGHDIRASVYIESMAMMRQRGPEVMRPIGEIEFANGVAAMSASGMYGNCRIASAIVGYADLRAGDDVAELLDRALACAPERFRGVRQVLIEHTDPSVWRYIAHPPPVGIMSSPGFRPAIRQLEKRGLSFDAAIFHHQLPQVTDLAREFPETTIILNHVGQVASVGLSASQRTEAFQRWRTDLIDLASNPNVLCKVGGLGQPFFGFGFEDRADAVGYVELAAAWKPLVESAIEIFGASRCMMESNFPADSRSCDFVTLWNALKHIVRGGSEAEKADLFSGTAQRAYRISLDDKASPGSD